MPQADITGPLLDLACAPIARCTDRAAGLSAADWAELDRRAAQHRLEPLLHDRLADVAAIPLELRSAWRVASRMWTLRAAAAAVDLGEACDLLAAHGFAPLALKGAFLAWHAYPQAALRPLRDIDILVPQDRAAAAFALLREHGYAAAPVETGTGGKHLPPLIARCGTLIELHHRLWERDGELDHGSPIADHEALWTHAVHAGGIAYPRAEDMLAHLIIHAIYSHRLDCGPLLLWDVHWLARSAPIDWPALRARAVRERWVHGLDLTLALCRRHLGDGAIAIAPDAMARLPADLVAAAAELLLQDLDTRRTAGFAATAMVRGFGALAARVGRGAGGRSASPARQGAARESLRAWTGARLRRTVTELADRTVRGQARDLSRLSRWLGA